MSLFSELKRRNVIRVGIAYLAGTWLIIQIAETLLPVYGFSDAAIRNLVSVMMVGLAPALILAWLFEWTPEGLKKDADVDRSGPGSGHSHRFLDRTIVIVLLLAVTYFAIDKFVLDPARDALEIEAATEQALSEAMLESYGDKSIAVLAFDDMSPQGDQEYFSDGMAEELLNLLATIGELRVISRSSAFSFKGSTETLKEIAQKLDVKYILEGSVRKAGNKIRITAQLIDARADAHLWSQTYDRTLDDVFSIQDEISAQVVDQLKLILLDDVPGAIKVDPYAYDLYLQALYIVQSEKRSQLPEALSSLKKALEIEPGYIPALRQLQRAYFRLWDEEILAEDELEAHTREISDRILAIDPDGLDTLIQQALISWRFDDDVQQTARYLEQAMDMDPANLDLLRFVANFLRHLKREDEAIALGNYLILRDPSCEICVLQLTSAYRRAGRHEEAVAVLEDSLRWRAPGTYFYWSLGVSWLVAGQPDKALLAFDEESDPKRRKFGRVFGLHDLGRLDEFEALFAQIRENPERSAEGIARIYAWTGDTDKAFEWLDRMVEEDGPEAVEYIDTDFYEKIKPDPRWRALRMKYGFNDDAREEIEFEITLPPGVTLD